MKTVIVLGTARSGTSMTAGILHKIGVEMHPENDPKDRSNPRGGFESAAFNSLTAQAKKVRAQEYPHKIAEEAKKLIADREREPAWGWKSALTHFSLPLWLSLTRNPHFVCVWRNPLRNALSWQRQMANVYKQEVPLNKALRTVCESNMALTRGISNTIMPVKHVTYNDLKADPIKVAHGLARFLELPAPTPEMMEDIFKFVIQGYSTIGSDGSH